MILSVAEKLDFQLVNDSKEYMQFKDTISESILSLIQSSCEQRSELKNITLKSYMIVAFTIGNLF